MATAVFKRTIRFGTVLCVCFAVLTFIQFAYANSAFAQGDSSPPPVRVGTETSRIDINNRAVFFVEPDGPLSLAEVQNPNVRTLFAPVTKIEPDFGYIQNGIWLSVSVQNASERTLRQYLMMHTNFMSEINVWWVTDGGTDQILAQTRSSTFASRPVAYSELIAPFRISPEQTGTIFIRYASNGDTVLPLSLVDDVGLAAATNERLIVDFAFYGLMAMVILASILFRLMFKSRVFVTYPIYVASVLLLIFQRDGYAFQFLWPDAPLWNNYSSLPLGAGLPLFAAIFTRTYLNTRALHPNIDKLLIGVVALQVAVVASSAVIGAALAKQLALMSVSIAIVVFISIGIIAYRTYGNRTLFFLIGWLGLLAGSITMTTIHWTDVEITRAQSLNIMRVAMVFDVLMMGLASIFRIVDLQRDRERLNQEKIDVLDANLRLHQRFARMEQRHQMAVSLAQTRSEVVSDLTHDLRQPIFALRSAIGGLSAGAPRKRTHADIEKSIAYLEDLVDSALSDALEAEEQGKANVDELPQTSEIQDIFNAVQTMFEKEAAERSVDLRFVSTTAMTSVAPFPIMRILANFVSNAVRYAPNARTLVGVRRRGTALALEVHDAGPGLSTDDLEDVMTRSVRGDDVTTDGAGLGLSIVAKLASKHALEWSFESREGQGSVARLVVPSV